MEINSVVLLRSSEGRSLVLKKCRESDLDIEILEQLITAELDQVGKLRKRGLGADFDEIFGEIDKGRT